jgi:hypothetical protein
MNHAYDYEYYDDKSFNLIDSLVGKQVADTNGRYCGRVTDVLENENFIYLVEVEWRTFLFGWKKHSLVPIGYILDLDGLNLELKLTFKEMKDEIWKPIHLGLLGDQCISDYNLEGERMKYPNYLM